MVVDGQMHTFPTTAAAVALPCAIAGDAVTGAIALSELLDIDMDEVAHFVVLGAVPRLHRRQGLELVQAQALEAAVDCGSETPVSLAGLPTDHAEAAQRYDAGGRLTYFQTVFTQTHKAAATTVGLRTSIMTRRD